MSRGSTQILLTAGLSTLLWAGLVLAEPTVATTPESTTAASQPPSGIDGRIVFTRATRLPDDGYGEATLFVADADGSDEQRLLEYGDIECCAFASRDGSRVVFAVFTAEEKIAPGVINVDGSGYEVFDLPEDGLNLGAGPFSPDGTRIAFEGFHPQDPGVDGIYLGSSSDGSDLVRVTEEHDLPGDFSPDGTQLAFYRPLPNTDASPLQGRLMIVDLDSLKVRQVTPDEVIIQCCPRWSPDGSRITFEDPDGSLWLIDPDGDNPTEIFHGGEESGYAIDSDWSPDGTRIMFALNSGPDPLAHPLNEILIINADGTGATTVSASADHKRELSWVPTYSAIVQPTDSGAPQETQSPPPSTT